MSKRKLTIGEKIGRLVAKEQRDLKASQARIEAYLAQSNRDRFGNKLLFNVKPSVIEELKRAKGAYQYRGEEVTGSKLKGEPRYMESEPNDGPARLALMLPRVGTRRIVQGERE